MLSFAKLRAHSSRPLIECYEVPGCSITTSYLQQVKPACFMRASVAYEEKNNSTQHTTKLEREQQPLTAQKQVGKGSY